MTLTLAAQTAVHVARGSGVAGHRGGPQRYRTSRSRTCPCGITIGQPIRSRDQYEASLERGPGPVPVVGDGVPAEGRRWRPARPRRSTCDLDVADAGLDPSDSCVYPAQVDLRSGGVPLAALNTAVVHIVRPPERADAAGVVGRGDGAARLRPVGRLVDPAFEAVDRARGGSLAPRSRRCCRWPPTRIARPPSTW